jgi:hypothetical protein
MNMHFGFTSRVVRTGARMCVFVLSWDLSECFTLCEERSRGAQRSWTFHRGALQTAMLIASTIVLIGETCENSCQNFSEAQVQANHSTHPIQMAEDNLTALGACMNASSGHGLSFQKAGHRHRPTACACPHAPLVHYSIFFSSTLIATQLSGA